MTTDAQSHPHQTPRQTWYVKRAEHVTHYELYTIFGERGYQGLYFWGEGVTKVWPFRTHQTGVSVHADVFVRGREELSDQKQFYLRLENKKKGRKKVVRSVGWKLP